MLGVEPACVTSIAGHLQTNGAIRKSPFTISIVDRARLESQSCECYESLRRHFQRLLPGVYPSR
jgi:hypothetical protein